jgi:O-antigen ligase
MLVVDILSLQISLNLFVFGYGFVVVMAEANEFVPPREIPGPAAHLL